MGDELRDPGGSMPRSIIVSILAMMGIYLMLNIGVLGAMPVAARSANSSSVACLVVTPNWGHGAADLVTVLIIITAFGSVFAGPARRVAGALQRRPRPGVLSRLRPAAPSARLPAVALVCMGVVTAAGSLLDLTTVINMLAAVAVIVQSIAQIVALVVLRRRQPDAAPALPAMALYPVPSMLALVGWAYVYVSATPRRDRLSLVWIVAGVIAFLAWARVNRDWPFGAREIREAYLDEQRDPESELAVGIS